MADLPSILGGMAQGFLDFGKSAVDLFGTGGASIADLIESARTGKVTTKNSDDFRKWLYDTNDVKDAAAKGLGTALNGVQTVSDYIPGIGAVTRNPLFNAGQGALGGLADEFKMYGKDYDLGRAGQRAAVGAGGALASTGLADALKGSDNALLKSGTAQGLARGAVGGAIGAGGYTAIDGGSLGDVANSALQGAGMGAALGGTMGALQDFKPARNYDMALTDEEKAARIANAKNMLANEQDPERIAELNNQIKDLGGTIGNAPSENMKLYRGISAPDDATLQRYIDEMKDPNIAPTTYSGGSAYGQGYYFTPDEGLARYYASESGLPSTAIMEIEVPRNRFTEISKENGNRPADFDLAAVKRGVPEDIRYETGLKDFNDYLDNNGYWGSKTGGENPTYTIMRNDAVLNAKRIDAPSLETALAADDMAVNSPRYLTDENGNPRTFYHGSPNKNITEFDINQAGKNTRSGERALYFTDSPEVADEFSYERIPTDDLFVENRGAKGRVYPVNLEMNNPLDLDNLTDAQIDELWPYASYMGSWQGKDVFTRDLKNWRDVNNAQLIKGYLDMDKLAGSPYDGFIARMYPNQDNQAREYAVFDNSKIKMLEDVLAADDAAINSPKLTPEQEAYFKDSVVRDENGNLMPLYHGSNSKFTVFDSNKGGQSNGMAKVGHWFTPSEEGAEKWAGRAWWGDNDPTVYETYLNIKKPMVYEPVDNSAQIEKLNAQLRQVEDRLDSTYRGSQEYYDAYKEYNNIANEIDNLSYTDPYEQFRSQVYAMEGKTPSQANAGGVGMVMNDEDAAVQKYIDKLKSEGYDGIIIKGTGYDQNVMGGPNDQYVVFDSNQIKSTSNRRPTSNADIYRALLPFIGLGGIGGGALMANQQKDKEEVR